MNTHIFLDTLKGLSAIPEDDRTAFQRIADDLSEGDRETVIAQLIKLNADMLQNEKGQSARLARATMIVQDVKEHDLPTLEKLANA